MFKKINTTHKIPVDLYKIISSNKKLKSRWNNITPIARNEWICWIQSAKKLETKDRRIKTTSHELIIGKNRPCCWAGCTHR